MFDNDTQDDIELFADGAEDDASDAGTSSDDDRLNLDAEESRKETAKAQDAQAVRQKTIESYQRRIDSGEITVDQIPPSSKWVVKSLSLKKAERKDDAKDLDTLLEEKLAKRENDREFDDMKARLESATLRKEQKAALQEEFKELRSMGVPTAKALKKAIALAGVSLDSDSSRKAAAMRLPVPGYAGARETEGEEAYEFEGEEYKGPKGTQEQRIAYLEKHRNSGSGPAGQPSWQRFGKK
jgi:hypothetical protein